MTPFNRPTEVKVVLVKGYISDIAPFSKLNTELSFDLLQQQKGYNNNNNNNNNNALFLDTGP